MKDLLPVKLLLNPAGAFEDFRSGAAGWGWPGALFALSTFSSAALLALAPAEFLAKSAAGLPPPGGNLGSYFLGGLAGGLLFALFSTALLAAFSAVLRDGRLMLRVPLPPAAVAGYAFFFLALRAMPQARPLGWLAMLAALAAAVFYALKEKAVFPGLLKIFLALSIFALATDLAGALAALAAAPQAYQALEYAVSFISLVWLVRGVSTLTGLPAARSAAAAVPAILGAAAFAFSLMALGLLPADYFQLLLMM
jgi:hypothetical protein